MNSRSGRPIRAPQQFNPNLGNQVTQMENRVPGGDEAAGQNGAQRPKQRARRGAGNGAAAAAAPVAVPPPIGAGIQQLPMVGGLGMGAAGAGYPGQFAGFVVHTGVTSEQLREAEQLLTLRLAGKRRRCTVRHSRLSIPITHTAMALPP